MIARRILWCGANSDSWNRIPPLVRKGWDVLVLSDSNEIDELFSIYSGGSHSSLPDVRFSTCASKTFFDKARLTGTILRSRRNLVATDYARLFSCMLARAISKGRVQVNFVVLSLPILDKGKTLKMIVFAAMSIAAGILGCRCCVLSKGTADFIRRLSLGFLDPIVTVPGVDCDHFAPRTPLISREDLSVPPDDFLMLYHGVVTRTRRLDLLLEVVARLKLEKRDVFLVIVGLGGDCENLQKRAAALGISDKVRFLGRVPYLSIPDYINIADVELSPLPGNQHWSPPYKALEAMACAKPVIASDVEVVRDINSLAKCLNTASNSPDDWTRSVIWATAHRDLLKKQGQDGREYVLTHHSWEKSIESVENVFIEMISKRHKN